MLRRLKKLFITCLFTTIAPAVFAGTGLETTRVIFNEKDRSQSVVAFNTDKKSSYLAQSWIENEQGVMSPDFIPTPPILKLRPEQKNTIQLSKNVVLKPDQESLYWLNVKFIPPVAGGVEAENILKFSMTHRIKLIYRPESLSKQTLEQEVEKLTWKRQGNQLLLDNPTAFYIHIAKIEIDGKEIKSPSYVAPYSQGKVTLSPSSKETSKIDISYINDYGKSILLESRG